MEVFMEKSLSLLFAIVLLMCNCAKINIDPPSQNISSDEVLKEQFLQNISLLAQDVSDQATQDTLSNIQERLILATPHKYGATVRESKESCKYILFIPLRKESLPAGMMWAEVISDKSAYAFFLPALKGVTIQSYVQYSEIGEILSFLHEAFHANIFANSQWDIQSDQEYFEEERDAYTFQGILMIAIGKEKYVTLLENEIARIAENVRINGIIPPPTQSDLEPAFGKAKSQEEVTFLRKSVWIHAVFTYLDLTDTDKSANGKKAIFLAQLAENGWTL